MALTLADEFVEERTAYYAQQDLDNRIEVKLRSVLPARTIVPVARVTSRTGSGRPGCLKATSLSCVMRTLLLCALSGWEASSARSAIPIARSWRAVRRAGSQSDARELSAVATRAIAKPAAFTAAARLPTTTTQPA